METSPLFDEIRAGGVREVIFHQGRTKFGKEPTRKQQKTVEAMTDLAQLQALTERLLHVNSWAELLDGGD
jgi:hypothetical protein